MLCIITAANSHCPDGNDWAAASIWIALIFAIAVYQIATLFVRKP